MEFHSSIHRALYRENLIAGCERELVLLSGLLAFALIALGQSFLTTVFGALLWALSLFFLRKMARKDPLLSKTYVRHIKYQVFYPAKARATKGET